MSRHNEQSEPKRFNKNCKSAIHSVTLTSKVKNSVVDSKLRGLTAIKQEINYRNTLSQKI